MTLEKEKKLCPLCGEKGRGVSALTLNSQLTDQAKLRLSSTEGFLFCRAEDCDVSYFGNEVFSTSDVRVPIFQKSTDPQRLACYCFGHSVAEIEQEVRETGSSSVPVAIRDSCKKGLDECEKNNPQGSCCLGNVSKVVKAAQANNASSGSSSENDPCCAATGEDA